MGREREKTREKGLKNHPSHFEVSDTIAEGPAEGVSCLETFLRKASARNGQISWHCRPWDSSN